MKTLPAKRIGVLLLAVLLCISLALPALAAEPRVYSGNDLYPGRTRAEIGQHYAAALAAGETYRDGDPTSYYSEPCSLTAPYAAGTLTTDTHAAMTAMTNYYRWLVGVTPLQDVSVGSVSLQKGALVRNWDFRHQVPLTYKPEDMDETLWNQGADAAHNIIAIGYTPRDSVNAWLNEGYDLKDGTWNTIGHRAALLDGYISGLQYGYSGRVAIGLIHGERNLMTTPFAAFPAAGDMPLTDVNASASAWTVQLNVDVLRCTSSAAVTVTNTATGESYTCTKENEKLGTGSTLAFVQPAPAEGSEHYADGDSFHVEITGLTDVATGGEAKIDYTVRFFDVRNDTPTTVTGAKPVGWGSLHIPEGFSNDETLRKLAAILPDTVQVQTAVGRNITLPVKGAWQIDTARSCFTNRADTSGLPADVTDPDGMLNEICFPYVTESYTGVLYAANASGVPGSSGTFRVWRYIQNCEEIALYQVTQSTDGVWQGERRYDTLSGSFYVDDDLYDCCDVTSWSGRDDGDWFAVYYSSDAYWDEAWVAGECTVRLACAHSHTQTTTTSASCTEPGSKTTVCTDCGAVLSAETISATGHTWGAWTVTRAATETAEGEQTRTCSVCKASDTQKIEKLQPKPVDPPALVNPFTDVTPDQYYYEPVLWALNHKPYQITDGMTETTFEPGTTCTRGQVVTFLWRAMGQPEPTSTISPFSDVQPTDYFYKAVLWANEKGITDGTSETTFSPSDKVTRGQTVTFLWRMERSSAKSSALALEVTVYITKTGEKYHSGNCSSLRKSKIPISLTDAQRRGYTPCELCMRGTSTGGSTAPTAPTPVPAPTPTRETIGVFVDVYADQYYAPAVLWAVENGITDGMDETHFGPESTCTRGQIVTFLYRAEH